MAINNRIWINPVGGLGDILMLSGVLSQSHALNPTLKYNLVRRSLYTNLLRGHPCIDHIGHPPANASIITSDYWSKEELGPGIQRAYQILARMFELETPVEEILYLPGKPIEDALLSQFIPSNTKKIALIAPSSVSPRKMMNLFIWKKIVDQLLAKDIFVVQVGRKNDPYLKGTYSLLGLTTPKQLVALISKANVVLTVDNFVMHAAHLVHKPTIVLWGPTNPETYGYPEQHHFRGPFEQCHLKDQCLGPNFPMNYSQPCPLHDEHCMNSLEVDNLIKQAIKICYQDNKMLK